MLFLPFLLERGRMWKKDGGTAAISKHKKTVLHDELTKASS